MRAKVQICAALLLMCFSAPRLLEAQQFAVGGCKPKLPSFNTITQAVSNVPAGSTVAVCPGIYAEQVAITQPITLNGVTSGTGNWPTIVAPAAGMNVNAVDGSGTPVAAQLLIESTGPVNLSDLTVDGSAATAGGCGTTVAGIFYHNSSGLVNHSVVRGQGKLNSACAPGILLENDSVTSAQSVTVENSSIHHFAGIGVFATTGPGALALTANLLSNLIGGTGVETAMLVLQLAGGTITNNTVDNVATGIVVQGTPTTVKGNRIANTNGAIVVVSEGNNIGTNSVFNSSFIAISVLANNNQVTSNTVTDSATAIGIYCSASTGNTVTKNTINEASTGIANTGNGGNIVFPNTNFNTSLFVGACL